MFVSIDCNSPRLSYIHLATNDTMYLQSLKSMLLFKSGMSELWGLVNNAGIMSFCDVEVTPLTEWQRLFDINCLGQVRMIQAFLPMLRRSQGRVVNVASTHGKLTIQ